VPGDPETITGGYIYDRRIADGLGRHGWRVQVTSLDASFPRRTTTAAEHARSVLGGLPEGRHGYHRRWRLEECRRSWRVK
jgi:hypothetical protein